MQLGGAVFFAFGSFISLLRTLVTGGDRHVSVVTLHAHRITAVLLLIQAVHSDLLHVLHPVWLEILNP